MIRCLTCPKLGLEKFNYINCSGVLHHLADPDEGFKASKSVLADDGAIGLMLYATTGRIGVYQIQALMRLVNAPQRRLHRTLRRCAIRAVFFP